MKCSKGQKVSRFPLNFPIGSPTISYKSRYLLHLLHWVTEPAQTHQNLSNGCIATMTPTVTSHK